MKGIMKKAVFLAAAGMTALALSGCSAGSGGKRIVRISHAQSETHPEHLGLSVLILTIHLERSVPRIYLPVVLPHIP